MLSNTTIVGRLTATPEIRTMPGEKRVATLRIAVDDYRLRETRFIDVDQWDTAADRAAEHLVQGQQVIAEGLLHARTWTPNSGKPMVAWSMARARIEWGPKPLAEVSTERIAAEVTRRREAVQAGDDMGAPA